MKNDLPISPNKKFKYSITFQSFDEESLEVGVSLDNGFEVEDDKDTIGEILYKANTTYGIYMPVSFGTWESTEPLENRDFFEKGIRKYFALHLTNEDGTEISQEENDFISYLLSDGRYEIDKFRDYAVGGIVLGSIALGVGALITYFYFKDKKVGNNKKELVSKTAKSVTYRINGKDRKFPIKDAWRKEHSSENKSEDYEVPQEDRFEMGGEIIFFDRQASMDESTRDELTEMTNYPYIKEYDVEENGEKKYDRIESELKKDGVSVKTIDNYLSGLYDGYNYSNTEGFKKEMAKLKLVDNNFYNKVMEMYDKVSKYPKIDKKFADGGNIKGTKIPENSKIRINYVSISVYKDSYEEGELENVNNYDLKNINGNLVSPKELVNFLSKNIYTSEDSSHYVIIDNNIHTSQLQDADGSEASKSELEEWKKGKIELYSANFVISVSIISEIEFNEQTLSSLTGIGIYKDGGEAGRKSVKNTGTKKRLKNRQPRMVRQYFEDESYTYADGGGVDKIPSTLLKRLENVENRYGVKISKKDAINSFKSGDGASSVGYIMYNADSHRASTSIGDISIDYGRWLVENDKFEKGGSIDLSTNEKAVMYSWVDNFLEKYSGDDNLSQSLDMYDEFSKKFNKSKEQTHDIIDNGWAKSRGYADGGEASDDDDDYADGGEVQDWMEQALTSLIEETGNEGLDITMVSDDGNEFFAGNDMEDYHVFKTEDDAQNRAVEEVRQYLEDSPENFSQEWLKNYIDGRNFFEEQLDNMNRIYAEDIASENDSKYANRLIAEMVENGIMDEDDALSGNAEELSDYYMQDFVNVLTESQLDEGNDGLDYFINNFGEEETYKMVVDNNLIDIDEASKDAVNVDGIGHFLSSYDGETLYLSNDCVAYRTN